MVVTRSSSKREASEFGSSAEGGPPTSAEGPPTKRFRLYKNKIDKKRSTVEEVEAPPTKRFKGIKEPAAVEESSIIQAVKKRDRKPPIRLTYNEPGKPKDSAEFPPTKKTRIGKGGNNNNNINNNRKPQSTKKIKSPPKGPAKKSNVRRVNSTANLKATKLPARRKSPVRKSPILRRSSKRFSPGMKIFRKEWTINRLKVRVGRRRPEEAYPGMLVWNNKKRCYKLCGDLKKKFELRNHNGYGTVWGVPPKKSNNYLPTKFVQKGKHTDGMLPLDGLFCGSADVKTRGALHLDRMLGVLEQLHGTKTGWMAPESLAREIKSLDPDSYGGSMERFSFDPFVDSTEEELIASGWRKVVLKPGDAIIIPPGFLHIFEGSAGSLSVSTKVQLKPKVSINSLFRRRKV